MNRLSHCSPEEALRRKPRLKTEDVSIYFIPAADELVV